MHLPVLVAVGAWAAAQEPSAVDFKVPAFGYDVLSDGGTGLA